VHAEKPIINHHQEYFCDGRRQNAVPEVLSQKDTSWNGVPELFPGIVITETTLLQPNFGSLLEFRNLFFKEIKLCLPPLSVEIHMGFMLVNQ
jgi:hypothetical protein